MMKCAVITYIFGNNKEKLHEPLVIDPDTEYLCITDQQDLKSKHWKTVYEPMPDVSSLRDKMAITKYNPFKYTNADYILTIDGSLQIKTSILPLMKQIDDYDIGLKLHPIRKDLFNELLAWKARGLKQDVIQRFHTMAQIDGLNLNTVRLYETNCIIFKNNDFCRNLGKENIDYMKLLGTAGDMIITNQCPFSYMMTRNYRDAKIMLINQNDWFNRYSHNSNSRKAF